MDKKDGTEPAFSCPRLVMVGAGAVLCLVFPAVE